MSQEKPEGLRDDGCWVPTQRQAELAGESLKLQEQIDSLNADLTKAIHATPPNPEGVRLLKEAINAGYKKLAIIRAEQTMVNERVRLERLRPIK